MTKAKRAKQARHNAAKDAGRRRLTEAEMQQRFADLRRQEAEANARIIEAADSLEDTWVNWTATYNMYTVPRLCAGFYYAALQAAKKRLIKSQTELFMAELSEAMQNVIDEAGQSADNCLDMEHIDRTFQEIKDKLEAEGYAVPEWAQLTDFERVKDIAKNGGVE